MSSKISLPGDILRNCVTGALLANKFCVFVTLGQIGTNETTFEMGIVDKLTFKDGVREWCSIERYTFEAARGRQLGPGACVPGMYVNGEIVSLEILTSFGAGSQICQITLDEGSSLYVFKIYEYIYSYYDGFINESRLKQHFYRLPAYQANYLAVNVKKTVSPPELSLEIPRDVWQNRIIPMLNEKITEESCYYNYLWLMGNSNDSHTYNIIIEENNYHPLKGRKWSIKVYLSGDCKYLANCFSRRDGTLFLGRRAGSVILDKTMSAVAKIHYEEFQEQCYV